MFFNERDLIGGILTGREFNPLIYYIETLEILHEEMITHLIYNIMLVVKIAYIKLSNIYIS